MYIDDRCTCAYIVKFLVSSELDTALKNIVLVTHQWTLVSKRFDSKMPKRYPKPFNTLYCLHHDATAPHNRHPITIAGHRPRAHTKSFYWNRCLPLYLGEINFCVQKRRNWSQRLFFHETRVIGQE